MILIALGSNLASQAGPPAATLKGALVRLEQLGVKILSVSSFYETPAWPNPSDPAFVNAVATVHTALQPVELLNLLHGVETEFGRMRSAPNAARTLDIDLLDYDGRSHGGRGHASAPAAGAIAVSCWCRWWKSRLIGPIPLRVRGMGELLAGLPDRDIPKKLA